MERRAFDDGFSWLEKYFKAAQPNERREYYWKKFSRDHDDVFCAAIQSCCEKLRSFPTPEEVSQHMTLAREARYSAARSEELKNRKPLSYPDRRNTDRGRQWIAGIMDICEGKITADQLIERMTVQKEGKPNAG